MKLLLWLDLVLADRARRAGRTAAAHRHLFRAVAAARRAGNRSALIRALTGLAQAERRRGRGEAAVPLYEEAVRICREQGDGQRLAHTVRHLGDLHLDAGNTQSAGACYREALSIYRADQRTAPLDLANALRPFAILQERLGDKDKALELWAEARELYAALKVQARVDESNEHLATLRA